MNLIRQLLDKNIIKFGNFTLKSGQQSNLYFDLRTLISYPIILNQILDLMNQKRKAIQKDKNIFKLVNDFLHI